MPACQACLVKKKTKEDIIQILILFKNGRKKKRMAEAVDIGLLRGYIRISNDNIDKEEEDSSSRCSCFSDDKKKER
jgi:hypothetical protein